jgi:peptide/nickel transport system substrate-binding protein
LFFNTSLAPFDNVDFRQALVAGTNVNAILSELDNPVQKISGPLLKSHIGYDQALTQQAYNLEKARTTLDALGWVATEGTSVRSKDGKQLEVTITTLQGSDFASVASSVQRIWMDDLGIKVNIITKPPADLQPIVLQHSYDVLLYGISLGTDPDVYAYWHSSQAVLDRFNLSLYKSSQADSSLEAGRTRPDIALRAVKYRPFLESWQKDAPAIALYQPLFFYVSLSKIYSFEPARMNGVVDRFYNVHDWQIQTAERPILDQVN